MPHIHSDVEDLARLVRAVDVSDRAAVVGISGFGGAGKTTLAAALHAQIAGSRLVTGDDFLGEQPPTARSDDWSVMDRAGLRETATRSCREAGVSAVLVEGLGLFAPELVNLFDVKVWVDVDLQTATRQGMRRDEHVWHNPQTELWLEVWEPNDADFYARFRPDRLADVLYRP